MENIDTIENGLRFAVELKGEVVQPMSLADRMQHHHVPGVSITLINNGEIEWAKGYGLSETGKQARVETNTLFQAASISKPVSALAALVLVQQGLLYLDQDVNGRLISWQVPENEFTQEQKVTLRRLFSHNAGMTVHGFPGYASTDALPTVPQILDGLSPANTPAVRVDVEPGSIWRYSGGGTTVAQLLMMDVTGKSYAEIMHETVLAPLGMQVSSYEQPLPEGRWQDLATAHQADGEPYPGNWHIYPEQAAAGLWTTPSDLARYVIELQKSFAGRSNRVLSQEMTREMLTVQFADFGIGLGLGGKEHLPWFRHGGSNAGFRCEMLGFLHAGQGIVVMTNGDRGSELISEIIRSAAAAYGWTEFQPRVKEAIDLSKEVLSSYLGHYQFIDFPEVEIDISLENGHLVLDQQIPVEDRAVLYPQSETRFFRKDTGLEIDFSMKDGALHGELRFGSSIYKMQRVD